MMRVGESFCPGILHAVHAKDGLLTRIRVPGGMISPSQLTAIAEISTSFADGHIEVTSRSNLQLRAIQDKNRNYVVQGLDAAGLLPSSQHDRVRNIVTSPFAGLGLGETLDTRAFVRELDRRLIADRRLAGLPPKFSFAIHGGGAWFSREGDDLTLRAIKLENVPLFHLAIGAASSGFGVAVDRAVDCLLEAARICLDLSRDFYVPARGKTIILLPQAMDRLLHELSHLLVACPAPGSSTVVADMPVGVYPTEQAGFISMVPSIPLGRLTAAQTESLASIASEWGAEVRLAPWRGVVLGSIPEASISQVTAGLDAAGLSSNGRDGYRGIAACAGITGCDASLADVRQDASLLAQRLAGRDAKPAWTVNLSGCEKQCAMRSGATAELIANSSGYDVRIHGRSISNCSLERALNRVVESLSETPLEVLS